MAETGFVRRKLGSSAVDVPPLCFGTSALGSEPYTYGYDVPGEQALETIRAVFAGPSPFIDTSRNYAKGRSETLIGKVIRELGGLPDGCVLSSKLDRDPVTDVFGASEARRSLEESLEALGLSKIPLLHLHDPEHTVSVADVMKTGGALDELMKMRGEGLCDAVGLAAGRTDIMIPILKDWDFDAMITHNRFTLVNRHAEPMIDLAVSKNVSVMNAAPFSGGILAKGTAQVKRYVYQDANDETLAPIRKLEAIAQRYDVPLKAAALQFSMRDERITATICGITKPERIAETVALANHEIPDAFWEEIADLPVQMNDPEEGRVI